MDAGDTIVAVATPPGEGAIGIVRLSGPAALRIVQGLFRRPDGSPHPPPRPRTANFGRVVDEAGETIDECLLSWFPAPQSYTGEETVEISGHGSDLALLRMVEALCRSGARLAEPGEFTRRAFLNGRMDLARAEAVLDVIRARTDAGLRAATRQLAGRLSREIGALRAAIIGTLAEIEAAIDFPDDVEPPEDPELLRRLDQWRERAGRLLSTAAAGRIYREGATLVIAGRPNVGKSSLLNALAGEDRAIVTPVPGTTRDLIQEHIEIAGIPVRAVDTAGLRATEDPVERLGVDRAQGAIDTADLILLVVDATAGRDAGDDEWAERHRERVIPVANKTDLPGAAVPPGAVGVSALTGDGLEDLRAAIRSRLVAESLAAEPVWVTHARHRERLEAADSSLARAREGIVGGFEQAAVAVDLVAAAESLGEITGETVTEETVTAIFARFCVGK